MLAFIKQMATLWLLITLSGVAQAETLDVSVPIFDPGIPKDESTWKKQRIYPELRRAEANYLAVKLADTLTQTGEWGAVRVMPSQDGVNDITVLGTLGKSNGVDFSLAVKVIDSTGKTLLKKKYAMKVNSHFYDSSRNKDKEPYQPVLSAIAKDMIAKKNKMKASKVQNIKAVTELRFAEQLAPNAFKGYLKTSGKSKKSYKIKSAPAAHDPMMRRVAMTRLRDQMFVDSMQVNFKGFANDMAGEYRNYREQSADEYRQEKRAKKAANKRMFLGALTAIAGAVAAIESKDPYVDTVATAAIVSGAASVYSGVQKRKEARIYRGALREIAQSMEQSMAPQVIEFENETATLTGNVQQQYAQWRQLLARVYESETQRTMRFE